MNKEEIQHKLDEMTKRRMEINDGILWLKEQLAEAEKLEKLDKLLEKPKLRHGDFGMNMLFPRIVINGAVYNASGECIRNVDDGAIGKNCAEIWLGNVFDLMKDWSEPFEEGYKGNCAMGIRIEGEHIEIYSCTGTNCNKEDDFCDFNIVSAERFHNELGHAIAELKQKQGD